MAAALCLVFLDVWPLWQDEAFTWDLARRSAKGAIDGAAADRHPPLYYLLTQPFMAMGDADWLLRLPSALATIAGVALTGWTVRRHVGEREGNLAAWVMALAPALVLYADTARMYGVLGFFGAGLLAGALEVARGPRPGRGAIGLGLSAAGALWTHYAGFGAVLGAAVGGGLCVLLGRPDQRGRRLVYATLAFALAGASFAPWAMGPLQTQLATKDAPASRTLFVLAYLGWGFDNRVPIQSIVLVVLEAVGLGILLRRRPEHAGMWFGWALVAILFPYWSSKSLPAQNPRNYIDLLPAASAVVAIALARFPVWPVAPIVFALVSIEPLHDLLTRPVSPQETGSGYHYRLDAQVLDQVMAEDDALLVRPEYLLRQYERYVPRLRTRKENIPMRPPWVILARGTRLEAQLEQLYSTDCTFNQAFRVTLLAPPGPACDAYKAAIREVGERRGYVPFLLELGDREMAVANYDEAEQHARMAAERLVAHPAAQLQLAKILLAKQDWAGAADAGAKARDIAVTWRFPRGAAADAQEIVAKALAGAGDTEGAAKARQMATCIRDRAHPLMCSPLVAPFFKATEKVAAKAGAPAAKVEVVPPQAEGNWDFAGAEMPAGWATVGNLPADLGLRVELHEGAEAATIGNVNVGQEALGCGPGVLGTGEIHITGRFAVEVAGGGSPSFGAVEARALGPDNTVLKSNGVPYITMVASSNSNKGWTDFDTAWPVPEGGIGVKLCMKVAGSGYGQLWVDKLAVVKPAPG